MPPLALPLIASPGLLRRPFWWRALTLPQSVPDLPFLPGHPPSAQKRPPWRWIMRWTMTRPPEFPDLERTYLSLQRWE